jgi:peptide chain release factor 1
LGEYKQKIDSLTIINDVFLKMDSTLEEFGALKLMLEEAPGDPEVKALIKSESVELESKLDECSDAALEILIQPDKYDDAMTCTLEFRPGAGGQESELFAFEMMNTFQGYCQSNNWRWHTVSSNAANGGMKLGVAKVTGNGAFPKLKCESGVHKVIRVPETEAKGRLHSSTISICVLPEIPFDFAINEKDLKITFTTSQGPGGQHVNKTESACRVTHIPTGVAVLNQESREQNINKKNAIASVKDKVFQLEFEKFRKEEMGRRSLQMGSGDRSEKIRTYNFPQDRMTDHRTGLSIFGMGKLQTGEALDEFIGKFMDEDYEERVKLLVSDLKGSENLV